ncbi:MAG: PilZ domain-containing protein [Lachnospiraceae bacterium]|nr:PilZ domain-containing protein [Lachnospiraceae bacterium]
MQIKEMLVGKMLEVLVDREGYHYRFVSKVEGTTDNSVAVSLIAAKGRAFRFEDTDDVSIVYRGAERMWKWDHVKAGIARLDGITVHAFYSKNPGQVYNRRESFRVQIGESLLMNKIIELETEEGLEEKEVRFEALLADLSINGAGIYTNEDLEIGTTISFDMPTNVGILSCKGTIVRRSDVYDKPFRNFYGCDFIVVRKELERYLFERQRLMLQKERGGENIRLRNK